MLFTSQCLCRVWKLVKHVMQIVKKRKETYCIPEIMNLSKTEISHNFIVLTLYWKTGIFTNSVELKSESKIVHLDPYKPNWSNDDLIIIQLEPIFNLIGFLTLTKFWIQIFLFARLSPLRSQVVDWRGHYGWRT